VLIATFGRSRGFFERHFMTSFHDLGLAEPLTLALDAEGYKLPTPIQSGAIPVMLEGRDVLGIAQTGTGKTAAFALPLLHHIHTVKQSPRPRSCRVLVLTPTRELAVQVSDSFATYGRQMRFKRANIFGGVGHNPQIYAMSRGVDVLVATPGRLLDLMNQGHVRLDGVERFVLDEADRMLAMGFIQDVRKIVSRLPEKRQTVMFSATMPDQIASLAQSILHNPHRIEVNPESSTVERITQSVLFVGRADKRAVLEHLFEANGIERALIFTRTKHGANRLAEQLDRQGFAASAIHGNKSQGARQQALNEFREGKLRALVATDIAARGIDVDGLTHVINYELPNEPESYVHRIGRTARAGADGTAISLCELEEVAYLRDIEKSIRQSVPVVGDHPWHCQVSHDLHQSKRPAPRPKRGGATNRNNQDQTPSYAGRGPSRFNSGRPANDQGPQDREARPYRGRSDRPQADRFGDDRPRGDRPQADRFGGDRPRTDRPAGDRPRGDRPAGDRPRGDRPQADRFGGDRPRTDRPAGDRPRGDRPQADRFGGDRPRGERPAGDRPRGDRPQADRFGGDRPRADRPRGDRPSGDRPRADRPAGDRPRSDRPRSDRPARDANGASPRNSHDNKPKAAAGPGAKSSANTNRKPRPAGKDVVGNGGGWGRPQRRAR
jgi:ATP-dependent RNA helicase RhlE